MNERQMWKNIQRLLEAYKVSIPDNEISKDILDIDAAQCDTEYPDREELVDYTIWGPSGQSAIFVTQKDGLRGIYFVPSGDAKPTVLLPQDFQGDTRIPRFLKLGDFTKE